jgi:tRNA1(Val) A37 N6-methylase TrmN6
MPETETLDRVLNGRVSLRQPATGYRAAIDPILLAAACPAQNGETVLDLGCGVGTAALCLLARVPCRVTGLDIQPDMIALAKQNAEHNNNIDGFAPLYGSVTDYKSTGFFDHVIANPPYLPEGYGSGTPTLETHENTVKLPDWVRAAAMRVKPGGTVVFIHRADRLDELIPLFSACLGSLSLFPLYPKAGQPARRILIGGIKGSKAPPSLLPGMVLHQEDGRYSFAAEAILRDGKAIELWP